MGPKRRGGGSTAAAEAPPAKAGGGAGQVVTVDAMQQDEITEIACQYWAPYTTNHKPYDATLVERIYEEQLVATDFNPRKIVLLEFSQYLEHYLWPNFNPAKSTTRHVLSIIVMVNEKFRERIPAWQCFTKASEHFHAFFDRVLELALEEDTDGKKTRKKQAPVPTTSEQCAILHFLVNAFNSVEKDMVRREVTRLVHVSIWSNLLPAQRDDLFSKNKKLRKAYTALNEKLKEMPKAAQEKAEFDRCFLARLIDRFKRTLARIDAQEEIDLAAIHYCERFLELVIDLESLLTTRRFFNALLHSSHMLTQCTLSQLIASPEGDLFCQLVTMLKFYARFEIDDLSGQQLSEGEVLDRHYDLVVKLQKAGFKYFADSMKDFYLMSVGSVDTRKALTKQFSGMKKLEVYRFAEYLHLVPPLEGTEDKENAIPEEYTQKFLVEAITSHCERRVNQLRQLNEQPLYPTEKVIWDENLVPYEHYTGEGVLALNKLNLQFLTLHDYLLRNFNLFQMESTYEIRQDLEDVLFRMKPWQHESGAGPTVWGGWAKMALPLAGFQIVEVAKPLVGEKSPACVKADFTINLSKRFDLRVEWESLRKHDVCFLLTCRPKAPVGTKYDPRKPFKEQIQIAYVRGCEIEGMIDPSGNVIEEYASYEKRPQIPGDQRKYRVWLDPNQYRLDMEQTAAGGEDLYYTFDLIVKRDPKSNNFKAVLQTMRELLNTECVVPDWLHDLILGYGEPDSAHYSKMNNTVACLDFNDTFLSIEHVKASFPDKNVQVMKDESKRGKHCEPPYCLTFKDLDVRHDKEATDEQKKTIVVTKAPRPRLTPYPDYKPNSNQIQFTPAQVFCSPTKITGDFFSVEAIKSGMQPGLTMVVGPPGTGKTDVAVQIISNLYHNWPEQRTLIVTHSNQALNQLFEKIIALDIDERHCLRMGHGEEALETEKDFSRYGRVNYVLAKRLQLLKEVERLQAAVGHTGDVSYTCENAGHFFRHVVHRQWDTFVETAGKEEAGVEAVAANFPFTGFFDDVPPPLFKGQNWAEDWEVAESCWRHLQHIFQQLEEFRAFELLRTGRERTEYLLVKEAKIIAMTCTHAALRRKELVELGFRYDNILMEEAAQILEVETFIPLLLQNPKDGRNRLKRWIMIGDHHQLPPVVQNVAFQKFSNMEQSLFARFVRLGVPHVQLDRQGRARAEIAQLYNWRYKALGNLPHVEALPGFQRANPGFMFNYQLVDVPDFNGVGESTPSPYYYQNLGEAEYAVALFTYMRILGYPAEKISIITTYNGQAQLLRDVVERRCAKNPLIGAPHKISTVDKYQGQQNDYIILSLVRTRHIGHIRDVRRLIVALSRARLGLYVLGRASLFRNCFELTPAFSQLCQRPLKLQLLPTETFATERKLGEKVKVKPLVIEDTTHLSHFVHAFYESNVDALRASYEEHMKDYVDAQKEAHRQQLEAEAAAKKEAELLEARNRGMKDKEIPSGAMEKPDDEGEKEIVFESMDFERLEEVPKY